MKNCMKNRRLKTSFGLASAALVGGFLALGAPGAQAASGAAAAQNAPQSASAQARDKTDYLEWIKNTTGVKILAASGNWYCGTGQNRRFGCDTIQKNPGLTLFPGTYEEGTLSVAILFAFGPGTPHFITIEKLTFPNGVSFPFDGKAIRELKGPQIASFAKSMIASKEADVVTADGKKWPISMAGSAEALAAMKFYVEEHNLTLPTPFGPAAHAHLGKDGKVEIEK